MLGLYEHSTEQSKQLKVSMLRKRDLFNIISSN